MQNDFISFMENKLSSRGDIFDIRRETDMKLYLGKQTSFENDWDVMLKYYIYPDENIVFFYHTYQKDVVVFSTFNYIDKSQYSGDLSSRDVNRLSEIAEYIKSCLEEYNQ